MEKVEAIASALEAVFERVNEIVATSQWQKCECEATMSSNRAFVALGASWMAEDEPQSCERDTWICGVIPKETGELVNVSSPINKAEVQNSSTSRNSTDKAISEVDEIPVTQRKEETSKSNAVPREYGKATSSGMSCQKFVKDKPKVRRMIEDTKNK